MKTKIISVITAICLLLSAMNLFAFAAGEKGMISVGTVSAKVGEKVTVPVKMVKNPGILAIVISVTYDKDVLSFDSVNNPGKLFSKDEVDINSELTGEVVFALMTSSLTKDVTGTGDIFDIVFNVNRNAVNGTYPINVDVTSSGNMSGKAVNAAEQLVDFDFTNGTITVSGGKDGAKNNATAKTEAAAQQYATVESIVSYVQTEADGQPVTDKNGQSVTATGKIYVPAAGNGNEAGVNDGNSGEQLSNVPDIANDTSGKSTVSGPGMGAIIAIILLAAAAILLVSAVIITKKRNAAANSKNTDNEQPEAQPTETAEENNTNSENKE